MPITLPYDEEIADGCFNVTMKKEEDHIAVEITDYTSIPEGQIIRVELVSITEAEKLIAELDDPDGELMSAEGSICQKYEVLHTLRP